jgi:hypothetical protein
MQEAREQEEGMHRLSKHQHEHNWKLLDPSNYEGPIFICDRCGAKRVAPDDAVRFYATKRRGTRSIGRAVKLGDT